MIDKTRKGKRSLVQCNYCGLVNYIGQGDHKHYTVTSRFGTVTEMIGMRCGVCWGDLAEKLIYE